MLNYNWVILGDMFRPLNGHLQANLEQYFEGTVKIVIQWDTHWFYVSCVLTVPIITYIDGTQRDSHLQKNILYDLMFIGPCIILIVE